MSERDEEPDVSGLSYREIFDATSDALFVHDERGRILSVNASTCALFGCTREQALALPVSELSANQAPYTQEQALANVQRAVREGSCVFEWRSKRRSGELFWSEVALRASVLGGARRIIASVRDISERKRTEEALRESKERFSAIFRGAANAMSFTEPESGRILDVNESWVRSSGVSRERALGRTALSLGIWANQAHRAQAVARLREHGRVVDFETTLIMRGKPVPHLLCAELVEIRGVQYVLWEFRDVSEIARARSEQERLQAQFLHAQKMESVGRLAGGVAHDFNNLLLVINGNAELLLDGLAAADPLRASADEIRGAGDRAAALTRQLLAFSRQQVFSLERIDLNDLVLKEQLLLRA